MRNRPVKFGPYSVFINIDAEKFDIYDPEDLHYEAYFDRYDDNALEPAIKTLKALGYTPTQNEIRILRTRYDEEYRLWVEESDEG